MSRQFPGQRHSAVSHTYMLPSLQISYLLSLQFTKIEMLQAWLSNAANNLKHNFSLLFCLGLDRRKHLKCSYAGQGGTRPICYSYSQQKTIRRNGSSKHEFP